MKRRTFQIYQHSENSSKAPQLLQAVCAHILDIFIPG